MPYNQGYILLGKGLDSYLKESKVSRVSYQVNSRQTGTLQSRVSPKVGTGQRYLVNKGILL